MKLLLKCDELELKDINKEYECDEFKWATREDLLFYTIYYRKLLYKYDEALRKEKEINEDLWNTKRGND